MQEQKDFLLTNDSGKTYAGKHLIIDVSDGLHLNDEARVKAMLIDCAEIAGATVLHVHTHVFTPSGGISGVAVLAESHISIHSWPEIQYAAMDVFMCGNTQPELTIDRIKQCFETDKVTYTTIERGVGVIQ